MRPDFLLGLGDRRSWVVSRLVGYRAHLKATRERVLGSSGKSKKEGQEDQGTVGQLRGSPLATLPHPCPPSPPFSSPWAPWSSLKPPADEVIPEEPKPFAGTQVLPAADHVRSTMNEKFNC